MFKTVQEPIVYKDDWNSVIAHKVFFGMTFYVFI